MININAQRLLAMAFAFVLVAGMSQTPAFANQVWSATGPAGTFTVTDDSLVVDGEASFDYNMNPAGLNTVRCWTFETTSAITGSVSLDYNYRHFHAFFQTFLSLESFDADGVAVIYSGSEPGSPTVGTTTFNVVNGQNYGWTMCGSNFDSNNVLDGTFTITKPSFVGGELMPLNTMALFVSGLTSSAIWMIPTLAGLAGAGLYLVKFRTNKE